MTIACLMLCAKREEFIDLALESCLGAVDKVFIVGDPDEQTRQLIKKGAQGLEHEIVWRDWDGDYGKARNFGLSKIPAKYEWMLSLDADEVLSDDAQYSLASLQNEGVHALNLRMEHFIRDLGHVDATKEKHEALIRFYKFEEVSYPEGMHEVLMLPVRAVLAPALEKPVIYHLGGLKSIRQYPEKYRVNSLHSTVHSPDFLAWWKWAHVIGEYPTRKIKPEEIRSTVIRKAFLI